jgi:hypothetical protein
MIATLTFNESVAGTIFQETVTGHALTVNLPDSGNRVVLLVSDDDRNKLGDSRHLTKKIRVTDLITGIEHVITGTACGLGCRCAVTFVR